MSRKKPNRKPASNPDPPLSRRRVWSFRLMALAGMPLLCLALLESGLRFAGFGYPTAFLLNSSNHGERTFIQNDRFGWRFFGPRAARVPNAISIPRQKTANTIRVFVFGESAALGDPQPRFGLSRLLMAVLELRHPDKHFEIVNAAMTGINSHVILPLARDCEKARADVWVIYMGNNEVVGPFGAGTVFGSRSRSLPWIRASLALKTTRTGQFLDALQGAARRSADAGGEWQGMKMFLNYRLAASDPRLAVVYVNFERNLQDIIASGRDSGAKIVLSTVAVNLKDCAPFASLHRADLSASQMNDWQRLFDAGAKAQANGDFLQAATDYDHAGGIDDSYAELRFRHGQCALALKDTRTAQTEFVAACDLDALRFRCDSRLNSIIRKQANTDVILADGEGALAKSSPDGIPGAALFYEHVHLTFQGNYALARAIAEKIEQTLELSQGDQWPAIGECARRLGYTPRDTQVALSAIRARLADAPFTFQANHDEQMSRVTKTIGELPPPDSTSSLRAAESAAEAALARWPEDAELWEQSSEIKQAEGNYAGAAAAAQRALDQAPSSDECWLHYGILLANEQKYDDAVAAFEHELALDPRAVWARHNLAECLEKLGRRDDAVAEFKRTLALKPDYGTAWLSLGELYEAMGRTNDAERCYNTALTNRVDRPNDLAMLARFCASRGWLGPAVTNFAAAVELAPWDPGLRMEAGRALAVSGRHDEAARQYQAAVELAPDQALPHLQLGVEFGRLRKPALAEQEFRQALRLDPGSTEAMVNLGVALYEQKKSDDALRQFEDVLQRNPSNSAAFHYVQLLSGAATPPKPD